MKTETIEWFTPEEKLPIGDVELLLVSHREFMEFGYRDKNTGEWCANDMNPKPLFWAYAPKGPQ